MNSIASSLGRISLSGLAAGALFAAGSFAQQSPLEHPDRAAWQALEHTWPGTLSAEFDARGRFEQALGRVLVAPTGVGHDNLLGVAGSVLRETEELLGAGPGELVEVHRSLASGLYGIQLEQVVDGNPVRGSRVELRLTEAGDLLLLRARGVLREPPSTRFSIGRRDAGELARVAAPSGSPAAYAWDPRPVVLVDGARAAWEVEVRDPDQVTGAWLVTVDAQNGEVLAVQSRVVPGIAGKVEGRGIPTKAQSTGGPPVVLPLENLHVSASDLSALLSQITLNTCDDVEPVISGDGSTIVFSADCGSGLELWVIGSDGTGLSLLVSNGADNTSPAISDDGETIWFVSDVDGDQEIFTIEKDGSGLLQLTANTATDRRPSLADDGSFGTYESDADGDFEIHRVNNDGSGAAQLTDNTDTDVEAALAGDGGVIAWVSDADGDLEIHSMAADGSSPIQLTFNEVEDRRPSISDDGSLIAFDSRQTSFATSSTGPSGVSSPLGLPSSSLSRLLDVRRSFRVWEIRSDGGGLFQVTDAVGQQLEAQISGNGACIAYQTRPTAFADWEVELLDRGTGEVIALSSNTTDDEHPMPSDDCSKGVYQSDDGDKELTVWDTAGAGTLERTVTGLGGAYGLSFPDGASPSVVARLKGKWARVKNLYGSDLRAQTSVSTPVVGADLLLNPTGAEERRTAQVTAYYHTDKAHDWLSDIFTGPPLSLPLPLPIDGTLPVLVNSPLKVANAFYDLQGIHTQYFMAGPGWENTAIDTVVYHEYGHFTDDHFGGISPGSPSEKLFSLSEAFGDVLATYVSGQAIVGEDFFGAGSWIRNYGVSTSAPAPGSSDRQYDCLECPTAGGLPEEHYHGEAFAGFAWDLRTAVGAATAETLLLGAIAANPGDMPAAVTEVFLLAATGFYGGTGDPSASPLYDAICFAAAKHGFDCPPRSDGGSHGCFNAFCGPTTALHDVIGTEWMGATVEGPDPGCVLPPLNVDDDGAAFPHPATGGTTVSVSVTISVDPALKGTGRYGGLIKGGGPNLLRHVYLNGWLYVDDGGGGFVTTKIIGTGSVSPMSGPDGFAPNTVAFDPDTWAGASTVFTFPVDLPAVTALTPAIFRFRLDYGEDAGALAGMNPLGHPSLGGPCGRARYGEVEDHHFHLVP